MKPSKVFQFVNTAEVPEEVSLKKFDEKLRESTLNIPGYLNHTFPLYREVKYWPGATNDGDKNELVYRFGEGARGEIRFDRKANLTLRMELNDRDGLSLKLLLEEIIAFCVYFNRAIRLLGCSGEFRLSVALEGMPGFPVNYEELPEEDALPQFSNWGIPDEIVEEATSKPFNLPGSADVYVLASKEIASISELLAGLAFNVVGDRFDPMKGRSSDRLRLDSKRISTLATKLSQEIYNGLANAPKKRR